MHVLSAKEQPATRYQVGYGGQERKLMWIRMKPRALVRCNKCFKLRWAVNAVVQVYYDCTKAWCRRGKGCRADRA